MGRHRSDHTGTMGFLKAVDPRVIIAEEDFLVHDTILEGELVFRQPDEGSLIFFVFDGSN